LAANRNARRTAVATFFCPSDPGADFASPDGSRGTNYGANYGSGFQQYGYNGMFRATDQGDRTGVSARDVTDGLSRTAAVADILVGDGNLQTTGRAVLSTPSVGGALNLDVFANACAALTPATTNGSADIWSRGRPWISGDLSETGYNHVLPPNRNSCTNGTSVVNGAYASASLHSSGVEVLYADAHVEFTASSIARVVWRAIGSRNGGDAQ
jgi:hypothetical protein